MPRTEPESHHFEVRLDDMRTINRLVLVVEPTNVFLEWARKFPDEDPELTSAGLLEDVSAYLIPPVGERPDSWLEENYRTIFEIELNDWTVDPSCWPKDLSFKTFKEFFNIRFCSIVIDMADGPIRRIFV